MTLNQSLGIITIEKQSTNYVTTPLRADKSVDLFLSAKGTQLGLQQQSNLHSSQCR